MEKRNPSDLKDWFDNCGGRYSPHDLIELRRGIEEGFLNEQDEYGMTGLSLAAVSGWTEGVEELLRAGADTEVRVFRTGATALYMAVLERNKPIIQALLESGANPDAANHWGITPRTFPAKFGLDSLFDGIPPGDDRLPPPRIQNAEHLADHHWPAFEIPEREEREAMQIGQTVGLYVYGPKAETKQDKVKVRITARNGRHRSVRYTATVETPIQRTHLAECTTVVEFGPEHIATVYMPRPDKK